MATDQALSIVIVTGLSGSGKSTAIHVLEDLGYYCIDNLPVILIPKVVELCKGATAAPLARVALGVDLRERGFFREIPRVLDELRAGGDRVEILFLDAADEVLIRRFSETRRPHPLAGDGPPIDGIRRERELLTAVRERADRIVDTSRHNVHELREVIGRDYEGGEDRFSVFLVSFGFKYGIVADADTVFDVRFLPNPYFLEELRPRDGLDPDVAAYVMSRPGAVEFLERTGALLEFLLPRYEAEGKRYFTIAIGCTGGRHRSVAISAEVSRRLGALGYRTRARHRDIGR